MNLLFLISNLFWFHSVPVMALWKTIFFIRKSFRKNLILDKLLDENHRSTAITVMGTHIKHIQQKPIIEMLKKN